MKRFLIGLLGFVMILVGLAIIGDVIYVIVTKPPDGHISRFIPWVGIFFFVVSSILRMKASGGAFPQDSLVCEHCGKRVSRSDVKSGGYDYCRDIPRWVCVHCGYDGNVLTTA